MIIRSAQIQALEKSRYYAFERRMMKHLQDSFPWHYQIWGQETGLNVVRYGCRKAQEYGFSTEHDICLYLTLIPMLGGGFDWDPQLPWTNKILNDGSIREPVIRINRLVDQAMEFLDRTLGKNNNYLHRSLLTIHNDLSKSLTNSSGIEFQTHTLALLRKMFPQKYEQVGEVCLRRLIADGISRASKYNIITNRGQSLFIVLMFMLGSGFDEDPQLPDFAAILRLPSNDNSQAKEEQLHRLTMNYIQKWMGKPEIES